jgi:hypothetical protein
MPTLFRFAVFLIFASLCYGERVTAVGRAENDSQSSREQALTDALREAVRIGAGVNLASQSKTSNFALDYDRVFAAAFGYVQGYQVLECGVKGDGFYHVKISADVAKGDPNTNDKVALKQLIALKNSPIIALDIKETITFVPKNSGYAQSWFQEQANQMQLHVVELEANQKKELIVAQGDSTSKVRTKSSQQKVDFLIRGKVEGKYQVFDSGDDNPFSIAASFEAVCPDTGEIIATVNLSPNGNIKTKIESPQLAAKSIIEKCLYGTGKEGDEGASVLFRRIFTRWAADLDLGRKVRLEIAKIDDKSLRAFLEKLRASDKIHAVNKREFDANGETIIDLETRLNADELSKCLTRELNNEFLVDYETENLVSLVKDQKPRWKKWLGSVTSYLGI